MKNYNDRFKNEFKYKLITLSDDIDYYERAFRDRLGILQIEGENKSEYNRILCDALDRMSLLETDVRNLILEEMNYKAVYNDEDKFRTTDDNADNN